MGQKYIIWRFMGLADVGLYDGLTVDGGGLDTPVARQLRGWTDGFERNLILQGTDSLEMESTQRLAFVLGVSHHVLVI